ncbi:unnamed protein product [Prunus armeniaca]|uniref:Uncharacterized protein n=1 Tax=Prunus armeniaca TaxID=36596 RepID=A0A6J5U9Q4_PRUAR|nr:unnamed protein product [Prunus armeniaca]CAB4303626.1 unnamed protein product [Prunus armeniaca]
MVFQFLKLIVKETKPIIAIEIKTLELRIVAEVKLFGDFCFKLGAFGFAEMESSHSNTPNASNP